MWNDVIIIVGTGMVQEEDEMEIILLRLYRHFQLKQPQ